MIKRIQIDRQINQNLRDPFYVKLSNQFNYYAYNDIRSNLYPELFIVVYDQLYNNVYYVMRELEVSK